jgi:hypothetical protein
MITFDCLSQSDEKNQSGQKNQSDENNGQQQQQEASWTDFVERIFLRVKNPKTLAGSGQDTASFPSKIKDDLNQDKENSQICTESVENRGIDVLDKKFVEKIKNKTLNERVRGCSSCGNVGKHPKGSACPSVKRRKENSNPSVLG